ncbi:Syntaxin/t-SNARE family protein [Euphorbia peplus]|nr:Syntaxin/t-SNARE family protein [Euphorbia peplus]
MASIFDRWEKDPFFPAAEEVQESADRMESTYRTWMSAKKNASSMWNPEELSRDLRTALGTAKWQLDEFQRAVGLSYVKTSGEESRNRHRDFIVAMEENISKVEGSMQKTALSEGKKSLPWVRLDEGESNELALFLSGSSGMVNHSKSSDDSVRRGAKETKNLKAYGHRRAASASADFGAFEIDVTESQHNSSSVQPLRIPRKVPSVSGLLNAMEFAPKIKWPIPKNGAKKWRVMDVNQESDIIPLHSSHSTKDLNACYEKSKSCLDGGDCDKQLYGWYGVIQRQLQRSQYQMQYSRPVQLVIWIILLLFLIALVAFRAL